MFAFSTLSCPSLLPKKLNCTPSLPLHSSQLQREHRTVPTCWRAVCPPHPHPPGISHLHPHTGVSCAPSCCRFFFLFFSSARHGFPSRWLRAQLNLFINTRTLGGRAPWGSGSPHSQRRLLVPHWFFLSAHIHIFLSVSYGCVTTTGTGTPEWAWSGEGLAYVPSPLSLDNEALEGEGKCRGPVSPALGVGLPQALLRTGLPS